MINNPLSAEDRKIAQIIADLGAAAETELVARTLLPITEVRREVESLESRGLVRRRAQRFGPVYGDSLELTPQGYKSLD